MRLLTHKRRGAFTLIELMVVVFILALLIAILVPNLQRAQEVARIRRCQSNVHDIARAFVSFCNDGAVHRDRATADAPPISPSGTGGAFDVATGNAANLWYLVSLDYASRSVMLCPSAGGLGRQQPAKTDTAFSDRTLSYSFVSLVSTPLTVTGSYTVNAADAGPTILNSAYIVVGDRSPGISNASSNSRNHGFKGQNVGRLDTSGSWITSPVLSPAIDNAASTDNIWTSDGGSNASGTRGSLNDVFLIP